MRWPAFALAFTVLAACGGPLSVASKALGGGPTVLANGQAGATNSQTVGSTQNVTQSAKGATARDIEQSTGQTSVRSEHVETVIVREDTKPWVVLLMLLGWLLPSPRQIWLHVRVAFKARPSWVPP